MALLLMFGTARAQNFDDHFVDLTLRLDYVFSGDARAQQVSLDGLIQLPHWYGRRGNLNALPVEGNGQIAVMTLRGDTIYRSSFSSLFSEWLTTDEAQSVARSYENCFLVPMPRDSARIEIALFDNRRHVTARHSFVLDPSDILIRHMGDSSSIPYRYIWQAGDARQKIDVAILGEGYTAQEQELFYADAQSTVEALFAHEPFNSMRDRFNFVAVAAPSSDSGVSIPHEGVWKSTAAGSHFDTFYSNRYLTTRNLKAIHDLLSGVPYEHIIMLANTDNYGGGGIYNSYTLTTAHHPLFKPVVVHEFGHSFGALADEYFYEQGDALDNSYPLDIEPWEQNITTLVDFDAKWHDMLPAKTPIPTQVDPAADGNTTLGVYEGGGYLVKGVYRPVDSCRMRSNKVKAFCPVCQRAITRMIEFYTE